MKYLFFAVILAVCALMSGCGTINPTVSAALNSAGQDYMGAKANIQQTDDMKLRLWLDGACAVNIGALQRAISTSGNPSIANAIFTACPVPAVGVTSTSATGSMQVQTFNLPPIVRGSTLNGSGPSPAPQELPPASPVSTPAVTATPITANTSALQTYTPPKKAPRSRAPSTVAPSAVPALAPAAPASPAAPAFGTLAPNPNFPTTPAPSSQSQSALPSALPGQ